MADDRVELLVGGMLYAGWLEVGISRAMDAAAGAFRLAVTERWGDREEPWEIAPGDTCQVRVGGETVIHGYVDVVRPSFSATSRSIEVQGRDRSADLVDCAALHKPDQWHNIDLLTLANVLAKPFGLTARTEVSVGKRFDLVKLDHGEHALDALVRYARQRGVLVMPDGAGNILLTRAGYQAAEVALVQGENLLEMSGNLDWSQRYSLYVVKGQGGFSDGNSDAATEVHVSGQCTDSDVRRYRPLVVNSDADTSNATAKARANWEATTRIGKSASVGCTVRGWRQSPGGALWKPNLLVAVRAPWLRMDGHMLVRQVAFTKGAGGTTTQLELVSPQTYAIEPLKAKGKGKAGGTSWMSLIGDDVRKSGGNDKASSDYTEARQVLTNLWNTVVPEKIKDAFKK